MTRKRLSYYCPVVGGIHRSPLDSPHKGSEMRSFAIFFVASWIYHWNNRDTGALRRHDAYVMSLSTTEYRIKMFRNELKKCLHKDALIRDTMESLYTNLIVLECEMVSRKGWNGCGLSLRWWSVNSGSNTGLMSLCHEPLPEPILTKFHRPYGLIRHQWVNGPS